MTSAGLACTWSQTQSGLPGHRMPTHTQPQSARLRHVLRRDTVAHLGTLDFIIPATTEIFYRRPGTVKTHMATGLAVRTYLLAANDQISVAARAVVPFKRRN
jgi:hypothetical protein